MRLIERSVFCDRMVFVKAVHEAKTLSDIELAVYDSWFNPTLARTPQLVPDGFVYLKTNPETCERRMRQRNRSEETGVPTAYLERLNQFHESWLVDGGRQVRSPVPSSNSVVLGSDCYTSNTLFPSGAPCQQPARNANKHCELAHAKLVARIQMQVCSFTAACPPCGADKIVLVQHLARACKSRRSVCTTCAQVACPPSCGRRRGSPPCRRCRAAWKATWCCWTTTA